MGSLDLFADLETCRYLFLQEIGEPQTNTVRFLFQEGRVSERTVRRKVGGTFLEGHPVEIDDTGRSFEISWQSYVAFLVTNESFALGDESADIYEGRRLRQYSQSQFLQQIKESNHLSDEYPGPLLHFRIVCEHHLVDVVSTQPPILRRVTPSEVIN